MKTLLMTPSIALAFGLSGNAIAEAPQAEMPATLSLHEAVTHTKVSLVETRDFYQGDFLSSAKASFAGLNQADMYTGRGASEVVSSRWVTD